VDTLQCLVFLQALGILSGKWVKLVQEPSINLLSVLLLIGSAQYLFLAAALLSIRKRNSRANLFLSALSLVGALALLDGFLYEANYYVRYRHLIGVVWPFYFMYWPLLYFYVRELTSPKRIAFSRRQYLHFLPAVVSVLLFMPFYSMAANEKMVDWARLNLSPERLSLSKLNVLYAVPLLFVPQKIVYFLLSYRLVTDYNSRIKESFSSLEKISLSWLRTVLLFVFFLFFVVASLSCFAASLGIVREISYFFYLSLAGFAFYFAFKTILQQEIFSRIEIANQAELIRTDEGTVPDATDSSLERLQESNGVVSRGKYQKSLLTDERAAEIARQLIDLMDSTKPYLKPELTLMELAAKLSVSPHNLSQVFNCEIKKRFFDFVNEYRVGEAKKLLSSSQYGHYSIFGIALEAGFNSKSAFYTAFGKHAGMTPSEFRKRQTQA
jgi:AraC-like DNA-binding protein